MNNQKRYEVAYSFWVASFQYLILVQNVSRETVSQGNVWGMSRDFRKGQITDHELSEGTRWSDHTIIIPLLFNLLHGIELLTKGFILVDPSESLKLEHNISELCRRFIQKYPNEKVLCGFLERYTLTPHLPKLLRQFMDDNGLTIHKLYQALRYPSPDFTTIRNYSSLKYKGKKGTSFFADLSTGIDELRIEAVRLGNSLKP
ncbi:MAG: hypothetical protein ACYC99_03050 [Candidatus Geothermincolia bacterium]